MMLLMSLSMWFQCRVVLVRSTTTLLTDVSAVPRAPRNYNKHRRPAADTIAHTFIRLRLQSGKNRDGEYFF